MFCNPDRVSLYALQLVFQYARILVRKWPALYFMT